MSVPRPAVKLSYRDLVAWKRAVELVTHVYGLTKSFPDDERYGLTAQLRRAAVSVASNIAEGQGRFSRGEFKQFLGHARGSLLEIETQMTIATNLGYLDSRQSEVVFELSSEVGRILNGLISSLNTPQDLS
ncbi:MAG TPA: four helix bundle protein [Terriglobales bacterium]|jgi:four helix bundle protein|nr:four helix bundle protein [Terriglobales bacterium]